MNPAIEDVFLHTGDFHFGGGHLRLRTLLGSCIAITVWHPQKLIGGMCHYMLPGPVRGRGSQQGPPGLYAIEAVDLFLMEMHKADTRPQEYVTKLFGGGNMFPEYASGDCNDQPCDEPERNACRDVACRNIVTGRELLDAAGFVISAENVGGFGSRTLIFEVWSGAAWLRRNAPLSGTGTA